LLQNYRCFGRLGQFEKKLYIWENLQTMFKSNSQQNTAKTMEAISPDNLNRLVEGTSITGEIISEGNIRIDGKLKGTIATKGKLVIGPKGVVEGEIVCGDADIEGKLLGTIKVNGLLSLKSTSKLEGDIFTGKLAIEPGASFSGACSMGALVKDINATTNKRELVADEKTA
jgi:cytoskeletal protein CcmA (bactofilin family)